MSLHLPDFLIENGALTRYQGKAEEVIIPRGVTVIGNSVFYGNKQVRKIVLPDTVTEIQEKAFGFCENLEEIQLSPNITSIGESAFSHCKKLRHITIPRGVTEIKGYTFANCLCLSSIDFHPHITTFGQGAFEWCESLVSLDIPEAVTGIGDHAFAACTKLTRLTLPRHPIHFENAAFLDCPGLADENGFIIIRQQLFGYCGNRTRVKIPEDVTRICGHAFQRCDHVTSITIPTSVEKIENRAFLGCMRLTELTIPEGIELDSEWLFYQCRNLRSVTLPKLPEKTDIFQMFLQCNNIEMICAPGVSPLRVYQRESQQGRAMALGYLLHNEKFTDAPKAHLQEYRQVMRQARRYLLKMLYAKDAVHGLALFQQCKLITARNCDKYYLNPAIAAKATGCVAFLLDWKHRNGGKPQDDWKL